MPATVMVKKRASNSNPGIILNVLYVSKEKPAIRTIEISILNRDCFNLKILEVKRLKPINIKEIASATEKFKKMK